MAIFREKMQNPLGKTGSNAKPISLIILFVLIMYWGFLSGGEISNHVSPYSKEVQTGLLDTICRGDVPAGPLLPLAKDAFKPSFKSKKHFSAVDACDTRYKLLDVLNEKGFTGSGVEAGVALGLFSDEILNRTALSKVYSVDMWDDRGHDKDRIQVQKRLSIYGDRSCLLWDRFENVLPYMPDNYFDFVYVDGYAHTGEDGGKSIHGWFEKVRNGGVLAGHDYDPIEWPLVVEAVDAFVKRNKLQLHVMKATKSTYDCCDSWMIVKP